MGVAPKANGRGKGSAAPSRNAASREASARPPVGGGAAQGRLYIDPKRVPPGEDWLWVRQSIMGQPDDENVQAQMEYRGFVPVTTDEAPGVAPPLLPGTVRTDTFIRRGGSILMKRPRAFAQAERADLAKQDREVIASVNRTFSEQMNFDGKNFQQHPHSGVHESVDRGQAPGASSEAGAFPES